MCEKPTGRDGRQCVRFLWSSQLEVETPVQADNEQSFYDIVFKRVKEVYQNFQSSKIAVKREVAGKLADKV